MKNLKWTFICIFFCTNFSFAQDNITESSDNSKKADIPGNIILDIGFNQWINVPDTAVSGGANIELDALGSRGVNIYYFYEFDLVTEKLSFNPGIGLGLDNYSFEDNSILIKKTLKYTSDSVKYKELTFTSDNNSDRTYKKSKLSVNYVDIPLEFMYKSNKDKNKAFIFALGGKIGILFQAHTKVVYKEDGETIREKLHSNFFIETIRYGLTTRIGYGGLNLFGYYSLSKMFKEGKGGPEMTPFMVGLSFLM